MRNNLLSKIIVTLAALGLVVVRWVWPDLKVDSITLGLLVIAVLPWLSALIKSAELPGGWKVEFQDVAQAGEKITSSSPDSATPPPRTSYPEVGHSDPNLALVGLRIEIEKRLRLLAEAAGSRSDRSATRMTQELRLKGVLDDSSVSGLVELIDAGNRAAHGATVEAQVAGWAMDYGPRVLAALDGKLSEITLAPGA
jgi:hypothetical protein